MLLMNAIYVQNWDKILLWKERYMSALISSSNKRNDKLYENVNDSENFWITNTFYMKYTQVNNIVSDKCSASIARTEHTV